MLPPRTEDTISAVKTSDGSIIKKEQKRAASHGVLCLLKG